MKGKTEQFHSKSREAFRFHEIACPFFSSLNFKLIDDPSLILSPYQQTRVTYCSSRGFYLAIWFEPVDSNSACITSGRQWKLINRDDFLLSNNYSKLARRFGIQIPERYKLGFGLNVTQAMKEILTDLQTSLTSILERVSPGDLESIEKEKNGAEDWAKNKFGPNFKDFIEVSEFPS